MTKFDSKSLLFLLSKYLLEYRKEINDVSVEFNTAVSRYHRGKGHVGTIMYTCSEKLRPNKTIKEFPSQRLVKNSLGGKNTQFSTTSWFDQIKLSSCNKTQPLLPPINVAFFQF